MTQEASLIQNTQETTKELTHPKQLLFLKNLRQYEGIIVTCQATGIDPKTYYNWLEASKTFFQQVQSIKKEIDDKRLGQYEAELKKRILDEKSKQSDILLMFALKSLDSRYRDKQDTHITGDIIVKLSVPSYKDNPVMRPKELKEKNENKGTTEGVHEGVYAEEKS